MLGTKGRNVPKSWHSKSKVVTGGDDEIPWWKLFLAGAWKGAKELGVFKFPSITGSDLELFQGVDQHILDFVEGFIGFSHDLPMV